MASRRWSPFARGLLVAGVILWLVSALLTPGHVAPVTRSTRLQPRPERVRPRCDNWRGLHLATRKAPRTTRVAENLTHGTVLVDQMVEAVPVGGDEQPLI
ncbi:hypothetical protein MRX96_025782 [Rhipicephalus microplus]